MIASAQQDRQLSEIVAAERPRLLNFVRRRVANQADVEDVVQDVFAELVEANRLLMPIGYVTGWLYQVARNRITDLFRKKRPVNFSDAAIANDEHEAIELEELLPSPDAGPDALYLRGLLEEELEQALDELPQAQRDVFVAHELEGHSFREMAAETGVPLNTLLARKRYAVLHLRKRLKGIHDQLLETGGVR
jgi:RNA polymerase sigma factor (sigma-70 family)